MLCKEAHQPEILALDLGVIYNIDALEVIKASSFALDLSGVLQNMFLEESFELIKVYRLPDLHAGDGCYHGGVFFGVVWEFFIFLFYTIQKQYLWLH